MKADIIHDFQGFPKEEAENTEEALEEKNGYKHLGTIYEEKDVGLEQPIYLAVVLYIEDQQKFSEILMEEYGDNLRRKTIGVDIGMLTLVETVLDSFKEAVNQ